MKTVITKEVDGHQIITGFDKQVFDPMATKEKVSKILEADETFLIMAQEIKGLTEKQVNEYKEYWEKVKKNPALREKASYDLFIASQQEIQNRLIEVYKKVAEYKEKITKKNAVYFEPKKDEIPITDEKYDSLVAKVAVSKRHQHITIDGNIVEDYRGMDYYIPDGGDWKKETKSTLGPLPIGATLEKSPEVIEGLERRRIKNMTNDQREVEKSAHVAVLTREAAIKMNEMELSGEIDPKVKAREWLDKEKIKLEKKYSI